MCLAFLKVYKASLLQVEAYRFEKGGNKGRMEEQMMKVPLTRPVLTEEQLSEVRKEDSEQRDPSGTTKTELDRLKIGQQSQGKQQSGG